jgi:hypothetical protein
MFGIWNFTLVINVEYDCKSPYIVHILTTHMVNIAFSKTQNAKQHVMQNLKGSDNGT